jgi:uncharacterized protein (TIGR00297 family)
LLSLPWSAAVSAGVTWISWQAGALTASGAAAAWMVGTLVLYGTGWEGGAVLAAFFASSNLISRATDGPLLDAKGDRRDAWQVYANGGPAALAAATVGWDLGLGLWLVTASLAAAAADTWATSVGTRSRVPPRLLWSGRRVPPGTSGGVTLAGSIGAVAGALVVASTGALVSGRPLLAPIGTLIGFLGMLVDSAVGGALQGRFYCIRCNQPSEWRLHRCGSTTELTGGLAWMTNDLVNFIATGFALGGAALVWRWVD